MTVILSLRTSVSSFIACLVLTQHFTLAYGGSAAELGVTVMAGAGTLQKCIAGSFPHKNTLITRITG